MKVFIADDSLPIVERLDDLVHGIAGVEIAGHASDVPGAVRGIQEMKPDVLILDLQMPGGSGLDVLRAIRQALPALFVLICTNYPYPQFREECLSAGADCFLDKSGEFDKIPGILRSVKRSLAKTAH
jgi:two-component system response regulator DesR